MTTPVYVGNRRIGEVVGGAFRKSVSASKHFLKRPPAICFDAQSLADAEAAGAAWCEVSDRDSGKLYKATIADVRRYGFEVNRGFGRQIALPLKRWALDSQPGEPVQQPAAQIPARQLSLFGGSL